MSGLLVGSYSSYVGAAYVGAPFGLLVTDAGHAHTAGNVMLESGSILNTQAAQHAVANTFAPMQLISTLVTTGGQHTHAATNIVLQAISTLFTNSGTSTHSAGNVVLDFSLHLSVANGTSNITDLVTDLEAKSYILGVMASHGHTADNLDLAVQANVVIDMADHASNSAVVTTTVYVAGSHLPIVVESRELTITAENRELTISVEDRTIYH